MHAPAEAVALRGGEELVFLGVIKVFNVEARLLLPEGRRRKGAFPISLERAKVMLQPGHESDMPHGAGWRERIEQIAHHGAIDLDVLGLRLLTQPGREKDVGRAQRFERRLERASVQKVGFDGKDAFNVGWRAPRQPICRPAFSGQMPSQSIAYYAAGSDHKRLFRHSDHLHCPGVGWRPCPAKHVNVAGFRAKSEGRRFAAAYFRAGGEIALGRAKRHVAFSSQPPPAISQA